MGSPAATRAVSSTPAPSRHAEETSQVVEADDASHVVHGGQSGTIHFPGEFIFVRDGSWTEVLPRGPYDNWFTDADELSAEVKKLDLKKPSSGGFKLRSGG